MKKLIAALIASAFTMGAFAQASAPAAAPAAPMVKKDEMKKDMPAAPMVTKDEMKKDMPAKKAHMKKHHRHHAKKMPAAAKPAV